MGVVAGLGTLFFRDLLEGCFGHVFNVHDSDGGLLCAAGFGGRSFPSAEGQGDVAGFDAV
ncbi:MAG: hypothetical protein CME19_15535 [Gemmatimonadetes bacterium]|nr:hypothetical protein [Gemmatimonadota bacterium]